MVNSGLVVFLFFAFFYSSWKTAKG